jgi:hypothetical protein
VEIKCQLDATDVFIADLIACSTCFGYHYAHHQELKSIIQLVAACGLWCCKDGKCDFEDWADFVFSALRVVRYVCLL